jgi:hypothetical protein
MEHYEIRVVGHLDRRRARALACERLRRLPNGHSVLTFAALDLAALYGLLGRLRDAGIELLAVERVDESGVTGAPKRHRPRVPKVGPECAGLREPVRPDAADRRAPRRSPIDRDEGR